MNKKLICITTVPMALKYLLKESFKQYFPVGFLNKFKQGFGVFVGDSLRSILKEE
tara:strand:+ start:100 stop:264 length:165 start_codon:yes stop_codon:yes gene_type:complete